MRQMQNNHRQGVYAPAPTSPLSRFLSSLPITTVISQWLEPIGNVAMPIDSVRDHAVLNGVNLG
eukprot:4026913-Amphidinium_carterae.1